MAAKLREWCYYSCIHLVQKERTKEGEGGKERKKFLVSWFHKRQKIHCLDLWFLKTFTCNVVLKTHLALYDLTGLGRNRQCIEPALGCVVFCFCVYNIPYYHQKKKKIWVFPNTMNWTNYFICGSLNTKSLTHQSKGRNNGQTYISCPEDILFLKIILYDWCI